MPHPPTDAELQSALAESGLSSAELAGELGVSIRTIQRARRGHVRKDIARKLYQLVHVPEPPEAPLGRPDRPEYPPDVVGGCVRPGAVVEGRSVAGWQRYDVEVRAQRNVPPARPGMFFVGWRLANR